jgi:hypothetical protein
MIFPRKAIEAHAQRFVANHELLRVLSIISSLAQCTRSLHYSKYVQSVVIVEESVSPPCSSPPHCARHAYRLLGPSLDLWSVNTSEH